jgi:hypothetical protein
MAGNSAIERPKQTKGKTPLTQSMGFELANRLQRFYNDSIERRTNILQQ